MEFFDNLLGFKRDRQGKLLSKLGVEGEPRREFVGSNFEQGLVVEVNNDKFLEILKNEKKDRISRHLINQSDTHQSYELYIDIGEGLRLKTAATSIDYSHERTLLTDLYEISFKYDPWNQKTNGVFTNFQFN